MSWARPGEFHLITVKYGESRVSSCSLMVSFLYDTLDLFGILGKRDSEIGSQHEELVLAFELSGKVLGDLIHNAVVTDGADELIT